MGATHDARRGTPGQRQDGMNAAPHLKPGWALVAVAAWLLLLALFPDLN